MRVGWKRLERAYARFRQDASNLRDTQSAVLRRILASAVGSEFLHRLGIDQIGTVEQFRRAVPILTYDDIAADVRRTMDGEPDVLFRGSPSAFIQTSGTTSATKWVPVRALGPREQEHARIDDDTAAYYFLRDYPGFSYGGLWLDEQPTGTWLVFPGRPPTQVGGHVQGLLSGYLYQRGYRRGPSCYFTKLEWLDVLEPAQRLYVVSRMSIHAPIRAISGLPDALSEMVRCLQSSPERLVRDVRDGTISIDLSAEARAALPAPPPNPRRAAALERSLGDDGTLQMRALWPGLALVRTLHSGPLAVYGDALRQVFECPLREAGYFSSEGHRITFPRADEDHDHLLSIHRQFYEFIGPDGQILLAHQLEAGVDYKLVLTTPHGLYRIDTQDLVQCHGYQHGAPLLQFQGRHDSISLAGEKLSSVQLSSAIAESLAAIGVVSIEGLTVVPHPLAGLRRPFYEVLLEPRSGTALDPAAMSLIEETLDRALGKANFNYDLYRHKTGALDRPRATLLEPGSLAQLRRQLLDQHGEQIKIPLIWQREIPACLEPHRGPDMSAD